LHLSVLVSEENPSEKHFHTTVGILRGEGDILITVTSKEQI